eukprot:CAMPEP_0176284550 /NCGR_PEP_ID=MMETSP0121_2-20121125/51908_1 /TAXON_ID=160619 /ORGANISM="Kryptoperidinium foliaceum, Strain CCMP 1326" /LENGTH=49 /DNA_ID= /DNA_START= /DNA_END= /DNA_ORIENTATION=
MAGRSAAHVGVAAPLELPGLAGESNARAGACCRRAARNHMPSQSRACAG